MNFKLHLLKSQKRIILGMETTKKIGKASELTFEGSPVIGVMIDRKKKTWHSMAGSSTISVNDKKEVTLYGETKENIPTALFGPFGPPGNFRQTYWTSEWRGDMFTFRTEKHFYYRGKLLKEDNPDISGIALKTEIPVHITQQGLRFEVAPREEIERLGRKGVVDGKGGLLSFKEVENLLTLHSKRKVELSEDCLAKVQDVIWYRKEIEQTAKRADEVKKFRDSPQVGRFIIYIKSLEQKPAA
jgi:hypothetical protein